MSASFTPFSFPTAAIPVLERPASADFTRGYRPVTIKGWLEGWPLYRALAARADADEKLAFLAQVAPDRKVNYTRLPRGGRMGYRDGSVVPNFVADGEEARFADFTTRLAAFSHDRNSDSLYLQSPPIASFFPELVALLPAAMNPALPIESARLWLGTGSHITQLHYDTSSNFMCVLAGAKRVTLFPPECLPFLYPGPPDRGLRSPCSLVDLLALDLEAYPLVREALPHAVSVVLEAGDVLHVPPYWWHHVESASLNLMLNFWQPTFPRVRTVLARCLEDLLLHQHELANEQRGQLHREMTAALDAGPPGDRTAAPLPGPVKIRMAQFLDVVGMCPDYWQRLYASFARHYTKPDPFPTLPGEHQALIARIGARRASGEEMLCF
jgi:hypothetical protein